MPDPTVVFREVTRRVCGTLDLSRGLEAAYAYLRELVPLDALALHVLDPERPAIRPIAVVGSRGAVPQERLPTRIPLSERARAALILEAPRDVRIVERPADDPATREIAAAAGEKPEGSILVMGLVLDGRRLGSLVFRAAGDGRYREEHAQLLGSLNEPFAIALANAIQHAEVLALRDRLADENRELRRELAAGDEVIGADGGLAETMELVRKVGPSNAPVLLLGETGAGKEVIAAAVHRLSRRREGPFVRVNCGAIPEGLIDAELFGHEKGAFTGAVARQAGRFERAHGGTLFLDELGDLPLPAQVKLLRVLQSGELERVGGTEMLRVDVRVIAATHRELAAMVGDGRFREDLWFRLSVFPIRVPPLRERRDDIPALAMHFLDRKARELALSHRPPLARDAMDRLLAYPWPGNVRELANAVERALLLAPEGPLEFPFLAAPAASAGPAAPERREPGGEPASLDEAMARHLREALSRCGGRIEGPGGAAELLRLHPSTLRHRLRKLGIPFGRAG